MRAFLGGGFFLLIVAVMSGCEGDKKDQQSVTPPAEVTVAKPLARTVTDALEYTGTTAALEEVEVRARVTGFLDKLLVAPRDIVAPGQPLFAIDPRPFQLAFDLAKSQLATLQAQFAKADFDANKIKDLYEKGVASADELTKETANRDGLRAAVAGADTQVNDAKLRLDWCTVTAPTRGRISRNLIDAGNVVTADTTVLARIVNDAQVYVYLDVSERDILTLRERGRRGRAAAGQPEEQAPELRDLRLLTRIGLMTEEGYPHEGYIDYAAPGVNPQTGTVQVRAVFDNSKGWLLAGLFVRVRVPIGEPYSAMTVTERALGSDQGQRYLLVVNDKNVVEYRPVKVGTLQEGLRVIQAGIGPEDRVIVNGIQRVRPGVTAKPVAAEMPVGPVVAASQPTTQPASSGAKPAGH